MKSERPLRSDVISKSKTRSCAKFPRDQGLRSCALDTAGRQDFLVLSFYSRIYREFKLHFFMQSNIVDCKKGRIFNLSQVVLLGIVGAIPGLSDMSRLCLLVHYSASRGFSSGFFCFTFSS